MLFIKLADATLLTSQPNEIFAFQLSKLKKPFSLSANSLDSFSSFKKESLSLSLLYSFAVLKYSEISLSEKREDKFLVSNFLFLAN